MLKHPLKKLSDIKGLEAKSTRRVLRAACPSVVSEAGAQERQMPVIMFSVTDCVRGVM